MKIALVTPYDYPYPGGVTEHVHHLDREFRALGHETHIIATSSKSIGTLATNVIKVKGQVTPIRLNGSIAGISLSAGIHQNVHEILGRENFDVVHIHEPEVPLLSLMTLLHSDSVTVGTFHAYVETNGLASYAYPLLMLPVLKRLDGRPNILFVGRMDERKGFRHLLRAYPHIKQRIPKARLLIVGAYQPDEVASFVRYTRFYGLDDIYFIGEVSGEDLRRYYRTATIFSAPSTGSESFGIILLEAMAAGVPIVSSDIAGYRSVLTHEKEGLLVEPGNELAIARAITDLLDNPERLRSMAAEGKRTAQQYDWKVIAPRILEFYGELLGRDRTRHVRSSEREQLSTRPRFSKN